MKLDNISSGWVSLCRKSGLIAIFLFFISFGLRVLAIGRYVTPDELIWVYRSVLFRQAVLSSSWTDTLVAGHPGVITTWLGSLAIGIQILLKPADFEVYQWITHLSVLTPDNIIAFQKLNQFLSTGRLAVTLVNSLGIVGVYFLGRRLLGACLGLFLGFLLAVDPFFAGLSGLFHVDGLVTTFVILSLLSLTLTFRSMTIAGSERQNWFYALISGGSAALAVLSKSPALLLVPIAGVTFLMLLWLNRNEPFIENLKKVVAVGIIWLGSFLLILVSLYPALWTAPLKVLKFAGGNANRHMEEALRPTFFLGKVAYDHGFIFYPVSIAYRIGPVVAIGLILFVVLILRREDRRSLDLKFTIILVLWIVLFLALISITAKKFDRYALPVLPILTILAVIGWGFWIRKKIRWAWILFLFIISTQVIATLMVLPYLLSAYNLLLGGSFTAQYVMPIGWGESISSAGRWLASEVDVEDASAASGIAPSLAPFFPGETLFIEDMGDLKQADFIIFTANSKQTDPQGMDKAAADLELEHVIRFGGLDQAWIYANPNPAKMNLEVDGLLKAASFGGKIKLIGENIQQVNAEIHFTAQWEKQAPTDPIQVKVKLQDDNGHSWAELEAPLLNTVYFNPENWGPEERPVVTYELDVPATIPPGTYHVLLTLVESQTDSQMPIMVGDTFRGVVYEVGTIDLAGEGTDLIGDISDFFEVKDANWLSGSLNLLGYSLDPERAAAGAPVTLDLYWQAAEKLPPGLKVAVQTGDEPPLLFPLSRFDSGQWDPGRIIQEKYRIPLPPDLEAGLVPIFVWPLLEREQDLSPRVALGEIEVFTSDRLFALPDHISRPASVQFEPNIVLRGVDGIIEPIKSGSVLPIILYWQAENNTEFPVTAFVHLIDEQGNIISQVDRWPGGLPSNVWAPGQVIIDEYELQIPGDTPPGNYQLAIGLYFAQNGNRLPATDQDGRRLIEDRLLLPITVE